MKRLLLLIIVVTMVMALVVTIGLSGCKQEVAPETTVAETTAAETTAAETTAAKQLVFGITMPKLDAAGFRINTDSARKYCDENGIKLTELSAEYSVETQTLQIEDFITQGVDAIIFTSVDTKGMIAAVEEANAAGIPIVAMDSSVEGGKLAGLIESDNALHGVMGCDLMADAAKAAGIDLKDLKVLELLGAQATSPGLERSKGFTQRAAELGITIVSSLPTEWQSDKAYNAVLDAFQANPGINAIFEASDIAMHGGVEPALKQINKLIKAGEKGHIIITSVDGGPQGIDAIRSGYIDGIAVQSLIVMGYKAAETAHKAVKGELPEEGLIVKIAPVAATMANVDSPDLWANQIK